MRAQAATVAIPVLNGERYLDEVLTAVRQQLVDREVELLIIDSGSTDRSLEIARKHDARVIQIPRSEFSHGGTRNLAMHEARGDIVVFLTQDATPTNDGWLAAMLEGFEQADDVALVFGPHVARPDASHMIAREMRDHFRTWGEGTRIDIQQLDGSVEALATYRAYPGRLQFFSDVNGAVAQWAWNRVPYRDVPYAEDQLIAREMIEAGFAKVFHPDAAVYHSHDYPSLQFLRRYFDEFRSLREVLGHVEPFDLEHVARTVYNLTRLDHAYLAEQGVNGRQLRRSVRRSFVHHSIRSLGAGLGTRADRLPPAVRRLLSLQDRSSFTPLDMPQSPLVGGSSAVPAAQTLKQSDPFAFVRAGFPRAPLRLAPAPGPIHSKESLSLAWVVPPWRRGSGGHMTIFRLVQMMERRGHRCSIFVFDPFSRETGTGGYLRSSICADFIPIEADVFSGLDYWLGADIGIATQWWTAYPMRDLPGCYEKVYLVQDFEPAFYPYSAEYIWAEETYRMGYRCVAYTPWMAQILRDDYALEADWFECGTDTDTYTFAEEGREPETIAVYARRETARRGVELSLASLALLKERRPETRIVLFGSNEKIDAPFECKNLGVVAPAELARLYRRSTVGLVLSLTTHSLVAQEMMASGLPVVELAGDNVSSALGGSGEVVVQAGADPVSLSEAIEYLLEDHDAGRTMARRARAFVEQRSWERSAEQLEQALRAYLARPRDPAAGFDPSGIRVADTLRGRRNDRLASSQERVKLANEQ